MGIKTKQSLGSYSALMALDLSSRAHLRPRGNSGKHDSRRHISQTFAASGTLCLGSSAMAPSGQAALHTPHPKHLVGSI
jgi:hypothetical protein